MMTLHCHRAAAASKISSWPLLLLEGQSSTMIQCYSATTTLLTLSHKVTIPSSDCSLADLHRELRFSSGDCSRSAAVDHRQQKRSVTIASSLDRLNNRDELDIILFGY
mmetsp:Transcript_9589/g.15897  ORF Transcript_9589/g.15897 Transcript_9589/m.15897 type:complete len:108 (-) Transcript_9589:233-556(-)